MSRHLYLGISLFALLGAASPVAAQVSVSIDEAPTEVTVGETYEVAWTITSPDPVVQTTVVWGLAPQAYEAFGVIHDGRPRQFRNTLTAPDTPGTIHYTVYVNTGRVRGAISERTIRVVLRQAPTPGPGETFDVVARNSRSRAIPDEDTSGLSSQLTVRGSGAVGEVTLAVAIEHTWRGDLELRLTSPAGTSVTLLRAAGNDDADDVAGTFGRDLQSLESLAAFRGEAIQGIWRLRVIDRQAQDVGRLISWSLGINRGAANPTPTPTPTPQGLVREITSAAGFSGEMSYGASIGDLDGDGDLDVLGSRIFRNDGNLRFTRLSSPDLSQNDTLLGSKIADVDNDGDLDIFVVGRQGVRDRYFLNGGQLRFSDRTSAAGLESRMKSRGAAFGDVDGDGFVDLYLCVADGDDRLYRNNGDGTFTNIAVQAGVDNDRYSMAAAMADYDGDGDLDIYVVNAPDDNGSDARNILYRNDGRGNFTDVAAQAGVVGARDHDGYGLAWGDLDNDGDLDLYVVNFGGSRRNYLFRNRGDGTFEEVATGLGVDNGFEEDNCVTLCDLDNDGDLDMYLSSFGPTRYYENLGGLRFVERAAAAGFRDVRGFNSAVGDLDGDGDLDLYDSGALYEGLASGNGNHWLQVDLVGTTSNRDGIGARLSLTLADGTVLTREVSGGQGYNATDAFRQHFGLGANSRVSSLSIRWPSGQTQTLSVDRVDQRVRITEPRRRPPATQAPGTIATVAGDGGSARPAATFSIQGAIGGRSWGAAQDSRGTLFFGLFDGGAVARDNGDGTATQVVTGLRFPMVFDFNAQDDLIIADQGNNRVMRATRAAGYGDASSLFGAGVLNGPGAARFGGTGKIYIADTGNHRIIEVEADLSSARIVAGGRQGLSGDGGDATNAALNFPIDMDVDARGALVIADAINNRLRAVNLASRALSIGGVRVAPGAIVTIAGAGQAGSRNVGSWMDSSARGGFSGDGGPATQAGIDWPFSPRFDAAGNVWFADADNHRIRVIDAAGVIHTVVGSARLPQENGFRFIGSRGRNVGDGGLAASGDLNRPMDLEVIQRSGGKVDLLIGDTDNNRVRKVVGLAVPTVAPPAADRTPPSFSGLSSVQADGENAVIVRWSAATDTTSASSRLRYRVFVSTTSGGQDLSNPTVTTPRGADRARIGGLQAGTRYYVIVRAEDEAGNVDGNTLQRSATTDTPPPTVTPVSFASEIQAIFSARCTGCHTPGGIGPFSLEPGSAFGNLVGARSIQSPLNRVQAGDPVRSYIVHKLRGTQASVGGSGRRMPLTGGALTDAQINLVSRWIDEGARNN